jgi:phosphohistidine phosphatase
MKILLLLRHAKSSWDEPTLRDFDRPLNKRGKKAAPQMGKYMRERKIKPHLVISSPAERAQETAALVTKAAKIKTPIRYDERIYEANIGKLLEVISQIDDDASEVLLVGHNPGMEEILELLTGEVQRMPTTALARITLNIDHWNEVKERSGQLDWIVKPKELANH